MADTDSFKEWDANLNFSNPLNNDIYMKNLINAYEKHNLKEAVIIGEMKIDGQLTAIGVMDTRFMMASMGQVVGEKITRLFERAVKKKMPVILFCCSGGARMQEGIISLMQMEKTSAAVKRHSDAGLLYVSVLTNPTMGGVCASFAMLADIVLAEENAMIGFAGSRVIEQNTGVKLPENFQTAEFQRSHGFLDNVISRVAIKNYLSNILKLHKKNQNNKTIPQIKKPEKINKQKIPDESAWEKVQIARSNKRPTSMDYIDRIFADFIELHGDRVLGDDPAIVGGIADFFGHTVTVIGQQKGKRDIKEAIYRNWGMASPTGYRKALRLMRQAEKFKRPIICLIDTIGAACGKEAEEQGQGSAIAGLLQEMSAIKVPILSIIISEGGSGGALALGVGNEVWMLENAIYSILTPEGYASILWRDNSRTEEAAELMKLKGGDLYEMGVVEKVISEPEILTIQNMNEICQWLEYEIACFIKKYYRKSPQYIVNNRYKRFRKF